MAMMNPYYMLGFNDPERPKRKDFKDLSKDEDTATKEIKKARMRLYRKYHPDKSPKGITEAKKQERANMTIKIDAAFQAVKNKKARQEFKSKRSALMQDPQYQELISMLDGYHAMVWLCFTAVALFVTMLPLILVLQIDGYLNVTWPVALIPFWLFDALMLLGVLYIFCSLHSMQPGNVMCALAFVIFWISVIVFEAMFCMHAYYKDGGDVPESMTNSFVYLAPLIVAICACCILVSQLAWQHVEDFNSCSSVISGIPSVWMRFAVWTQCAIAQTIIVALKINGDFSDDWIMVFIPTYLLFGATLLLHIVYCSVLFVDCMYCCNRKPNQAAMQEEGRSFMKTSNDSQREHAQEVGMVLGRCAVGICEFFCIATTGVFFGLLVYKLTREENNESAMSASEVAAPLLGASFLICCCFSLATLIFVSSTGEGAARVKHG